MKRIRVTPLIVIPFLLCAAASVAPAQTAPAIDQLFRAATKPGEPGVAVIVTRKGQVLHRAAYGMANVELGVALQPDHVLRIGSVTKQFTSAAIMMLAEEGKLAVTDPITKFLPDYPTQGKTITVEHLLTHTSGIQSYTDMPKWRNMFRQDMPLTELIDLFKNEPMQFEPGTRWRYNNSGYILLGAIVEKVSGKKYADFVQERMFTPLGMADTRYDVTDQVIPRRAAGYGRAGDRIVNAQYLSMTQPYAAGALMSTVDDLAKWDAALTAGRVINADSLAKMFRVLQAGQAETRAATGTAGASAATRAGRSRNTGAASMGSARMSLRIPSDGVYVAVLSNIAAAAPSPDMLARQAAAIAIGKPLVNPTPVTLAPEQLDAYVGRYVTQPGARFVVSREGSRLFVQAGDGAKTEIFPAGNDVFFVRDSFRRLTFQRDAAGTYVRLEIDDWGPQPTCHPRHHSGDGSHGGDD